MSATVHTTVVVLTYSAEREVLARCLRSVTAAAATDAVVLVDNGATWTPADIAELSGGGGVTVDVIRTTHNLGYAGGMNAGITRALEAGAEAVAVLNDDTVVAADWLTILGRHLDGDIGAVQPKLVLADGRVQSVGVRWRRDGAGIDIGFGEPDDGRFDSIAEIPAFTGGAVVFARRFLETVGGFDERFHLYYEDIDLARRGAAAGFRYLVDPAAVVEHEMSHSTGADPGGRRYFQERNRLWCLARHGTLAEVAAGLARSAARGVKHRTGPQWRAIGDGVLAIPRWRRERRHGDHRVAPLPTPEGARAWRVL